MPSLERNKEITVSVSALKETVKLKEPFLTILYYSTFLKIKRKTYDITDKAGCSHLRPKLHVKDDKRGYDLNYPRTIMVILTETRLKPVFGLSGALYDVSNIEFEFAQETLDSFKVCQRLMISAIEKEREWKNIYYTIDKRTFWKEKTDKLEDVAKALCGVQKFLEVSLVDMIVDIENLWRKNE